MTVSIRNRQERLKARNQIYTNNEAITGLSKSGCIKISAEQAATCRP